MGTEGFVVSFQTDGSAVIQLNQPEGIAIHNSVAFISDTANHRILMVPILEYEHLGCYKEDLQTPMVPSLEGVSQAGLEGVPGWAPNGLSTRADAVQQCARSAQAMGFEVFAVRNFCECASSAYAHKQYSRNGWSESCRDGLGSTDENDVYRLRPGNTVDLKDHAYIVVGKAYSIEIKNVYEEPRPGYFGDWVSSWSSAVDTPGHLAIDPTMGNLYFPDRGNRRLRVLLGTLGPWPRTQSFRCVNGMSCMLTIEGSGLTQRDRVGFVRVAGGPSGLDSSRVICGRSQFDANFPMQWMSTNSSPSFRGAMSGRNRFPLASLALRTVGEFHVCYCPWGTYRPCDHTEHFEFSAGSLSVVGPRADERVMAIAGVAFDLALFGAALSSSDRIRLVEMFGTCGNASDVSAADPIAYPRDRGWLGRGRLEGTSAYEVWPGVVVKQAAELAICWCDKGDMCIKAEDFPVYAGTLSVRGPTVSQQTVQTGVAFDFVVRGTGGFKITDRVRFQTAGTPCESDAPVSDPVLDAALPWYAEPCALSSAYTKWCSIVIASPTELVACWCGSVQGCTESREFNVLAARLSVVGEPRLVDPITSGPFRRAEQPSAPLNTSTNLTSIPQGSCYADRTVQIRAHTRTGVAGAGSAGPIDVAQVRQARS